MSIPALVMEDLRALARKHGPLVLIQALSQFVGEFALKGMEAELAEKRSALEQPCPRCRRRDAMIEEMMDSVRRTQPTQPQGSTSPSRDSGE